jgi:hypothetical protein
VLRRLLLTLAVAVATTAAVSVPGSPVHAEGGLSISSTSTFTVDAAAGAVRVVGEFTLTNTLPDLVNGTIINRRYFAGFAVPAPAASANPLASNGSGRTLPVTRRPVPGVDDYVLYDIDFAADLFYRDTTRVTLTYDITGNPPRSTSPIRVNPAYAAFGAFGIGDQGEVTVRVVVPDGFEVEVLGSDTEVSRENGSAVYTATDIANPAEFDLFISARNDDALVSTSVVTDDGDRFDVRSWPGDDEWQGFVDDLIRTGVPVLESLVGRAWPIDEVLEVRQAYTPYLFGYAGWFSAADLEIEIGEDLDQEVVLHELSHAWFSDNWFSDRWINEGLAQVYSNAAIAEVGGTPVAPGPVDPAAPGAVALNEWGDPNFTDGADEREPYGYNAAHLVVDQIVDEVGDDGMRRVFDAVADRTIAYTGDVEPETIDAPADWRRFLDLVEELGGATGAQQVIEQYVTTPDEAALLPERATARDAYRGLEAHGDRWAPPVGVRRSMSEWSFERAIDLIEQADEVLALRTTLDERSAALGVVYPATFEAAYEAADGDLTDVRDAITAQIDATARVAAAVADEARDDGLLDTIGFWGTDVPGLIESARDSLAAGDLAAATAAADDATRIVADASSVGTTRLALAVGGLALLVVFVVGLTLAIRRRRRRQAVDIAEIPEPDEQESVTPD